MRRLAATSRPLLFLSFIAFVSLGLPDGLLGVAWPSMRQTFGLPLDALGALFISSTLGYMSSSFLSGAILRRMRLGDLLALSCFATAIALIAYSLAPRWEIVVAFGLLAGLGAGAIDSALNAFAAHNYSPRTVNMLHAFYGLGTTLGPMLMTTVLVAGRGWERGYVIVAASTGAWLFTLLREGRGVPTLRPDLPVADIADAATARRRAWHECDRRSDRSGRDRSHAIAHGCRCDRRRSQRECNSASADRNRSAAHRRFLGARAYP